MAPPHERETIKALLSNAVELNEQLKAQALMLDTYTQILVEAGEADAAQPDE